MIFYFYCSFCYQGGFHMQLYINSVWFLVLSSGHNISCFAKSLETNALGFFGLLYFSSSLQLMLILSINSLLKVNSLLLGFLSVVLGLLILADLASQAPHSSRARGTYFACIHASARPESYLKTGGLCLQHGPTMTSKKWVRPCTAQ